MKKTDSKTLSFEPTYHDLVQGLEGPVWRPMFNPVRECVREERLRIEAEGWPVNDQLWSKPKRDKAVPWRNLLADATWLLTVSCIAWLIGFGVTESVGLTWVQAQAAWLRVLMETGMGWVVCIGIGLLVVHLAKAGNAKKSTRQG